MSEYGAAYQGDEVVERLLRKRDRLTARPIWAGLWPGGGSAEATDPEAWIDLNRPGMQRHIPTSTSASVVVSKCCRNIPEIKNIFNVPTSMRNAHCCNAQWPLTEGCLSPYISPVVHR